MVLSENCSLLSPLFARGALLLTPASERITTVDARKKSVCTGERVEVMSAGVKTVDETSSESVEDTTKEVGCVAAFSEADTSRGGLMGGKFVSTRFVEDKAENMVSVCKVCAVLTV